MMRTRNATRRLGWVLTAACLAGLPLAGACAAETPGATRANEDAGASDGDGALGIDAGSATPGALEADGDSQACADFRNDASGEADCEDLGCARSPVCCVGSTSAACCAAPEVTDGLALDFARATCADLSSAGACVSGAVAFGSSASAFVHDIDGVGSRCTDESAGAMAPQGSERSDAGLYLSETYDTGVAAILLEATVGVGSPATGSIDAVGIGLSAQTDLGGAIARVRPLVAIVVSATDQTVRAVSGDVTIATVSLASLVPSTGCQELDLRIETSPAGTFTARARERGTSDWTSLATDRPFQPAPGAHPIVYGRTTNPGLEGVHAWVRTFGVAAALCDVLAPSLSPSTVFEGSPTAPSIRSFSRLADRAAYESNGTIYGTQLDGRGHFDPALATQTLLDPRLDRDDFMLGGVADPELAAVGVNVRLFFTGISEAEVRSIGYVDLTADLAGRVTGTTPRQILAPSDLGPDVLGVDGPAYLETEDIYGNPRRLLVFRADVREVGMIAAHTEIRAVELVADMPVLGSDDEILADPNTPAYYSSASPHDPTEALYQNPRTDEIAFDRDEIAQPEVISYGGIYRIFYAGRRGARWSIGMLRSPDFLHFARASSTPVLVGSGSGFDAVSVSDPDASRVEDELSLYYTGEDGVLARPGLAAQRIEP